jgi:myo-inositol 2-dehydrogenase/D-chiro-inositol 1-dehydrogenase
MKIGLIGLGRIGQVHLESLGSLDGVEVVCVSDIDETLCQQTVNKFNIPKYTLTYEELVSDTEVQAVWVCSPSNLHFTHVTASLINNKLVFCEKPLEIDIKKIKQLIDQFPDINKRLMVGFNRRFDPNFSFVKNNIQKIGKPTILKITSRDPEPPPIDYIKTSGGIFMDMTIHDFDMASFMVDAKPISIYSTGGVNYNPAFTGIDIDTAMITIKFENGVVCNIDNSRKCAYGYDQRLEFLGDQGMLSAENEKEHQASLFNSSGLESSLCKDFFIDRYIRAYSIENQTFVQCAQKNIEFPVTADDALIALQLAQAANLSLKQNKVIHLND